MTRFASAALVVALLTASPGAGAHGVGGRSLGVGAQSVEFYYASGEPMAYAAVRLFAPTDAEVPFVDGRADRLGRFAFLASEPGAWRVEANDGDGHTISMTVQAGAAAADGGSPGGMFSVWRLALWLSLSANILVAATWLRARRPGATHPLPAE